MIRARSRDILISFRFDRETNGNANSSEKRMIYLRIIFFFFFFDEIRSIDDCDRSTYGKGFEK